MSLKIETTEPQKKPQLLTKAQVAEYFQVKPRTIDDWMARKLIAYRKIAHTVRFDLEQIRK